MTSQKFLVNLAVVMVVISVFISQIACSPVPGATEEEAANNMREGRFYGMAGSQASAIASAGATGLGYPGFGGANANAFAAANAGAGSYGYPYGRK